MKITIVIDSLTGGGAQRAAVLLLQGLMARDHRVSLVTIYGEEADFYQLPPGVPRIALAVAGASPTVIAAIRNNIHRFRSVRQAIAATDPEVVISFLDKVNVLTLIASWGQKYPILISEQNDPSQNKIGRMWHRLRRIVYPWATQVVSCSQGVDRNWHWLAPQKRAVIYNPLALTTQTAADVELPSPLNPENKTIVAMGRLTPQKGFDLLLDAFARIASVHPDWQLLILGEGELREELEAQKDRLGLQNRVAMPGIVSDPFPLLKKCDLFVLSSRYEGFGNVIIEAMACGLPVIATDCPSGPNEIIVDGVNGILVPNQDTPALATAMSNLIKSDRQRFQLATAAKKSLDRFELSNIVQQWEQLIDAAVSNQSQSV